MYVPFWILTNLFHVSFKSFILNMYIAIAFGINCSARQKSTYNENYNISAQSKELKIYSSLLSRNEWQIRGMIRGQNQYTFKIVSILRI